MMVRGLKEPTSTRQPERGSSLCTIGLESMGEERQAGRQQVISPFEISI